jgi:hypothetical protein
VFPYKTRFRKENGAAVELKMQTSHPSQIVCMVPRIAPLIHNTMKDPMFSLGTSKPAAM